MRIVICSNLTNGIGLQKDYELLRALLEEWGHEVDGQQFNEPLAVAPGDLCIWLEVFDEHLLSLAPRHSIFLNPEWTKPETVRPIQRHCERVFAKTLDAERVLKETFPNVTYVGFLAEDKLDRAVTREPRFLHLGGNSGFRNTNAVISAWREYRWWNGVDALNADLTVVSTSITVDKTETPGITFLGRCTDAIIKDLQNRCMFHLFPSSYEGWGQALHEGQSCGAIILSTNAPPMCEFKSPREIPSIRQKKNNFGILHEVSPAAIREAVPWFLSLPNTAVAKLQTEARARFEQGNEGFRTRFKPFLAPRVALPLLVAGSPVKSPPERSVIALLGNFDPPHSTENDLLWTLSDMGYRVLGFQENRDRTEEILEGCQNAALFIWIHTHSWTTPGQISLDEMLVRMRSRGIKTASFHLDRYVGLDKLDGRETRVGTHPFWRTDTIFTADGGNQEFFKARGINHVWLPPGVVKRDCYIGEPQADLAIDVGFVGAEGYHPEYPFRGELINFLRSVYGDRFRIFTGYRGERLNNLYASIKVTVGDSCFGGADYYWSDRVPETLGRGGFLIHPACRGMNIPGLVTFTPGDLFELQDKIDFALEQEWVRKNSREIAMSWVVARETYHNRLRRLLQICGAA